MSVLLYRIFEIIANTMRIIDLNDYMKKSECLINSLSEILTHY